MKNNDKFVCSEKVNNTEQNGRRIENERARNGQMRHACVPVWVPQWELAVGQSLASIFKHGAGKPEHIVEPVLCADLLAQEDLLTESENRQESNQTNIEENR